jgi:hypothetical protein
MLEGAVQSGADHGFVKRPPFIAGPSFLSWGFSNYRYYSFGD